MDETAAAPVSAGLLEVVRKGSAPSGVASRQWLPINQAIVRIGIGVGSGCQHRNITRFLMSESLTRPFDTDTDTDPDPDLASPLTFSESP